MNDIVKQLSLIGIVPVIKIDKVEDAKPLAKALIEGGLPCAEVTFRTACAKEAIKVIADEFPEMIVGAGTVVNMEQLHDAVEAGAQFIVCPGTSEELDPATRRTELLGLLLRTDEGLPAHMLRTQDTAFVAMLQNEGLATLAPDGRLILTRAGRLVADEIAVGLI